MIKIEYSPELNSLLIIQPNQGSIVVPIGEAEDLGKRIIAAASLR